MADYKEVIFISDIHFGVRKGRLDWVENIKGYFDNFFIPLVESEKKKKNKPCVVIAGDFFEDRAQLEINAMNSAIDVMEKLSSVCDVYMMIGNHDIYKTNDKDVNSLRIFRKMKNVTIVDDEYDLVAGGKTFKLISWVGNMSTENKLIAKYNETCDFLVFHTELCGMTYDNNLPIVNGLNVDISSDDCRILSGHIHKRQESKKAMYFGSPYHLDRKDMGNTKGIYIFREKEGGMERIFIENTYSPVFLSVKYSDVGKEMDNWKSVVSNNYVDIHMTTEEINGIDMNKFTDELASFLPKNITIHEIKTKVVPDNNEMVELIKQSTSVNNAITSIFDRYVNKIDDVEINQEELIKMNMEYIKRAEEEL